MLNLFQYGNIVFWENEKEGNKKRGNLTTQMVVSFSPHANLLEVFGQRPNRYSHLIFYTIFLHKRGKFLTPAIHGPWHNN